MFNRREVPTPVLNEDRLSIDVAYGRRIREVQVVQRPDGSEFVEVVLEPTPPAPYTIVHSASIAR